MKIITSLLSAVVIGLLLMGAFYVGAKVMLIEVLSVTAVLSIIFFLFFVAVQKLLSHISTSVILYQIIFTLLTFIPVYLVSARPFLNDLTMLYVVKFGSVLAIAFVLILLTVLINVNVESKRRY